MCLIGTWIRASSGVTTPPINICHPWANTYCKNFHFLYETVVGFYLGNIVLMLDWHIFIDKDQHNYYQNSRA